MTPLYINGAKTYLIGTDIYSLANGLATIPQRDRLDTARTILRLATSAVPFDGAVRRETGAGILWAMQHLGIQRGQASLITEDGLNAWEIAVHALNDLRRAAELAVAA